MKKIKKVDTIEAKRAFIIPQEINSHRTDHRFIKKISKGVFDTRLKNAKEKILKLKESELDKILYKNSKKRFEAYNMSDWYICEVSIDEVGVWTRAGGLPLRWTNDNLGETAKNVKMALETKSKLLNKRARYTIPNMLETNVGDLQKEIYLFPIMFKHNTGTRGRYRLKKHVGFDIDDGCMRSITLAVSGVKNIKAYIGFPKN